MVTRRDMIGLAAAGLAGTALESSGAITRSAQALRGAMMGGAKKWQNPYIADGLVAMWDGEWNAGGGVHDASSTVWKDLSESAFDIDLNGGFLWGNDYIECLGTMLVGSRSVTPEELPEFRTAEAVIYNATDKSGVIVSFNGDESIARFYTLAGSQLCCTRYSSVQSYETKDAVSFVFGGGNTIIATSIHVNGESTQRIVASGSLAGTRGLITLGAQSTVNNILWHGKIFNMRFYNRALSSEEIAANYAVDAARFNI